MSKTKIKNKKTKKPRKKQKTKNETPVTRLCCEGFAKQQITNPTVKRFPFSYFLDHKSFTLC